MTAPVSSPCVNVCEMDAGTAWCRGCARRIEEIAGWGSAPQALRQQVLAQLPARRAEMLQRGVWLGPAPSGLGAAG
jgi:predicted Fe-S protein YdhL (DUF1289 family)